MLHFYFVDSICWAAFTFIFWLNLCYRTNEKLSFAQKSPSSLRSQQRDSRDRSNTRKRVPVPLSSPGKSPALSESPPRARKRVSSEDRRYSS